MEKNRKIIVKVVCLSTVKLAYFNLIDENFEEAVR